MPYEVVVLHDGYSKITEDGLGRYGVSCNDIDYVVCSHGHSDHTGNNNLFLNAKHIVGYSVSFKDIYYDHLFEAGNPFCIDENVKVIPTPGHTGADVSVLVNTQDKGLIAVTGDLFEKEEDIRDPTLWQDVAGSENPELQKRHRNEILRIANWIIPGHGPIFKVTEEMKNAAK